MKPIERLLAERACERLVVEYSRLVDFGHASRIADLFTADGRWEGTDLVLEGQEQIRAWFSRREGVTRRVSRHVCTNVGIDVRTPEEAEGICYLINYRHDRREGDMGMPVPAGVPKFVGECHDRFRRTPEGWRFVRRHVEVAFMRSRSGPAVPRS